MIDHRSYKHNLSSCEIKAWEKFRPEQDSNPWPQRYRCSALPAELSSHWELVMLWVCNIPVDDDECKWLYERSYIWTAEKDSGLNFFQALILQLLIVSCVYYCNDQSCLHIFLRSSNIWSFIYSLAFAIIYGYITNSPHDQLPVAWYLSW